MVHTDKKTPSNEGRTAMDVDDEHSSTSRPSRPPPLPYNIATPQGAPGVSMEGEEADAELRERARRSRNHQIDALEEENRRLRAEVFDLQQQVRRTEFEHTLTRERLTMLEGDRGPSTISRDRSTISDRRVESRSYHPYPRRGNPPPVRDSSVGPERSVPSRYSTTDRAPPPAAPSRTTDREIRRMPTMQASSVTNARRQRVPSPPRPPPGVEPIGLARRGDPYEDFLNDSDDNEYDDDDRERREVDRVNRAWNRQARRHRQPPPTPKNLESTAELHGVWVDRPIDSIDQWNSLRNAVISGDDHALRYLQYLNTKHQINATHVRSEGIRALVQGFGSIIKHDAVATRYERLRSKNRKPRADVSSGPNAIVLDGPAPAPAGPSSSSTTANTAAEPVVRLPQSTSASSSNSNRRPGPSATNEQLVHWWSKRPVPHWPQGLRLYNGDFPPDSAFGCSRPLKDDVAAMRYLWETNPARRHQENATKQSRRAWHNAFVSLFSTWGLYKEIVSRLGAPMGHRIRAPFPFDTRNLELHHVAAWLHDHGLDPSSTTSEGIQDWAHAARARHERTRPADGAWVAPPHDVESWRQQNDSTLAGLATHFAYPPIARIVGTRPYLTESEAFVAANRQAADLPPTVLNSVSPDEECPDDEMLPSDSVGDSNSGQSEAKGPA